EIKMLKGIWGSILLGTAVTLCAGGCRRGVELDPSLSQEERERVQSDLSELSFLSVDSKKSQWFSYVFSKPDARARGSSERPVAAHVGTYLDERIQYVLPEKMIVAGRFRIPDESEESLHAAAGFVVATNIGTSLYYQMRMQGKFEGIFTVDQKQLRLRSPRVGLVQLGLGFVEKKTPAGTPIESLFRLGILVHEARHSDCATGLSEQSLQESIQRRPVTDKTCGHIHAICPPGHTYEGRASCDIHPWGAYAVEAIFLQGVAEGCRTCTAQQRATAKLLALDRLSRLDPTMAEKMFDGKLGLPNMIGFPEEPAQRGNP
ncbi:MAG: hypothetical protein K2X47_04210, partial [Bdellovibrionales bacterium]|nr:hypothetical protein [Bdellovibrionales bacterium]